MNKKLFALLGLLMIAAMILTACQPSATPTEETMTEETEEMAEETEAMAEETEAMEEPTEEEVVTIEWWTVASEEYSEEAQAGLVEQFESEHPNIKVNMTILPSSGFSEKMTTALGAGEGAPDVAFYWDNNWWPEAMDLTPFIEADDTFDPSMYFPGYWETRAVWGDVIVGLPLGVGANFVMYNKDVFDEVGLDYPTADWTTDEALAIADQLTDLDVGRWGWDRPRGPFRAIFFNYGARPYDDASTTVDGYLNGDETLAAYTWLWDLVDSGTTPTPAELEVLGTEGTGPVDLFLAGRLAMATLNQGHMLNAVDAGMNFGIVPEPGVEGNDQYVHGWALTCSMWSKSEHPQEAWEFLSYWVGYEGQKYLMENGNLFPSIPEALDEYEYADTEYAQAFFNVLALEQDAAWLGAHPCYRGGVERAISDLWDLINLSDIARDEIPGKMEELIPAAQDALDECVPRLGG
jgi:multiple sugar transport system substrate-binding protein